MSPLVRVDFEVFGKVQGVYFRKYTQMKARELGVKGWVMNTSRAKRTVVGVLEGDTQKVEEMKKWLQNNGSPKSRIDRAEFKNEKAISLMSYDDFDFRK